MGDRGFNPFICAKLTDTVLLENSEIINAIVENQNLGRFEDTMKYSELLYRNVFNLCKEMDDDSLLYGSHKSISNDELNNLLTVNPFVNETLAYLYCYDRTATEDPKEPYQFSSRTVQKWQPEEHARFLEGIERFGKHYQQIADFIGTRTKVQVRSHYQKFVMKQKKGSWDTGSDDDVEGEGERGGDDDSEDDHVVLRRPDSRAKRGSRARVVLRATPPSPSTPSPPPLTDPPALSSVSAPTSDAKEESSLQESV